MSSQNKCFHCLAENERFAILSLTFLVWGQNIFAFCPKSPIKKSQFFRETVTCFYIEKKKLKNLIAHQK